ncbi:hypothetical protein HHK36_024757 [Tetracentron sinense]|uniref:Uncharacterized protein n=1 Tax=Tetracentron sinense TaxID=13715 RepID=A0A834YQL4_TETSI|nr:hypothetical protein HHK36_024757 [Tetracentron sinense]
MMIQRSEREGWAVEGGSAAENARLMRNRGRKGKRDEGLDHGEDRMAYAFSRDGAMSFPPLWHKVNKQEVPINAVWLSIVWVCKSRLCSYLNMHLPIFFFNTY